MIEKRQIIDPFNTVNKQGEFDQSYVRLIFTTSLAENNLNIHNIRYVIDSGLSREHHFDDDSDLGCQRLIMISRS